METIKVGYDQTRIDRIYYECPFCGKVTSEYNINNGEKAMDEIGCGHFVESDDLVATFTKE